jgi:transcriptional antiterminator RfaH
MRRWYLIRTKPASEVLAQEHLRRQGYDVYLPLLLESFRRGSEAHERIVALFPRYLFLQLNEGQQALGPVRSSVGVSEIVRFGESHATVPDHVIRDLRARADAATGLHRIVRPAFESGAAVTVTLGPFASIAGVFEREAGEDRVVILLRLLGRDTPIRIPATHVLPGRVA